MFFVPGRNWKESLPRVGPIIANCDVNFSSVTWFLVSCMHRGAGLPKRQQVNEETRSFPSRRRTHLKSSFGELDCKKIGFAGANRAAPSQVG